MPYIKVNVIFICLIVSILLYSLLFPALEKMGMTVPSTCIDKTRSLCKSEGLSRAFSYIIRGQLEQGKKYNRRAVIVFTFFLVQLALRIVLLITYKKFPSGRIIIADTIFSTCYFITVFAWFLPF